MNEWLIGLIYFEALHMPAHWRANHYGITKMFDSGPSVALLHFDLERSRTRKLRKCRNRFFPAATPPQIVRFNSRKSQNVPRYPFNAPLRLDWLKGQKIKVKDAKNYKIVFDRPSVTANPIYFEHQTRRRVYPLYHALQIVLFNYYFFISDVNADCQ